MKNLATQPRIRSVADLERLEHLAEAIEKSSDADIVKLREQLAGIEATSWRGQCMCDAELLSRAIKQQPGRGHIDEERLGVLAAAREISRAYGISNRTVLQNAQIHRTFFATPGKNSELQFTVLRNKQYFVFAMHSADPLATIESFAKARKTNPDFNTTDARRMLRRRGQAPPMRLIESAEAYKDDLRRQAFDELIRELERMASTFPVPYVCQQIHDWRSWTVIQRDRTPAKDEIKIRELFLEIGDFYEPEDLAADTSIPVDELKETCNQLIAAGYLEQAKRGGKTESASGASAKGYRRVK